MSIIIAISREELKQHHWKEIDALIGTECLKKGLEVISLQDFIDTNACSYKE